MALLELALGDAGEADSGDHLPALIAPDVVVTRGELRAEVAALSTAVASITTGGDRIALASNNRPSVVALQLAVPTSGRVLVPLNTRLTADEMAAQVERSGATVVIGTASELGRLAPALDRLGARPTTVGLDAEGDVTLSALAAAPSSDVAAQRDGDAPAWIVFTSGSTGQPKGAVLTAASLGAAVRVSAASRPLADDDVYLYPFPLFHVSAYNVLHALHRRRPVVLPRRFDVDSYCQMVADHQVTTTSLAPTMLRMVLDHVAKVGTEQLSTLRSISYGAAPMPLALLQEATQVLGVDFAQGYGMTELSGNAVFLSPADHRAGLDGQPALLRAAGRPGLGVDLKIIDSSGTEAPTGESGEICVRADQVCAGYWDDPAATAEALRDGWLHTGDVGFVDTTGLLTIVDRAKDIIITGGENVASREVEDALSMHPAVAQVAVVGLPDDRWGEAVVAAVVLREGIEFSPGLGAEITAAAGEHLARYKLPKRVEAIDSLPVNGNGKVDKPLLRRRMAGPSGALAP